MGKPKLTDESIEYMKQWAQCDQHDDIQAFFEEGEYELVAVRLAGSGCVEENNNACERNINNNMFDSSKYERSVQSVIKENDMVKNALDEFKFKMHLEYQRLLTESARLKIVAQEFKKYSKVKS